MDSGSFRRQLGEHETPFACHGGFGPPFPTANEEPSAAHGHGHPVQARVQVGNGPDGAAGGTVGFEAVGEEAAVGGGAVAVDVARIVPQPDCVPNTTHGRGGVRQTLNGGIAAPPQRAAPLATLRVPPRHSAVSWRGSARVGARTGPTNPHDIQLGRGPAHPNVTQGRWTAVVLQRVILFQGCGGHGHCSHDVEGVIEGRHIHEGWEFRGRCYGNHLAGRGAQARAAVPAKDHQVQQVEGEGRLPARQRGPVPLKDELLDIVAMFVGLVGGEEFVKEHSEGEHIHFFGVFLLAIKPHHFRGHEPLCPPETFGAGW